MSALRYNSATLGGSKTVGVGAKFQRLAAEARDLRDMIDQQGVTGLRTLGDFGVPDGPAEDINVHAQGFNDTLLQTLDGFLTWWGDGSGGTPREKVARFAKGD